MALNIFSVNKISAYRVALHLPSSSALRSTLEDLPTFASRALYCTNSLPSSSFLSLSSCSLLASSESSLPFSNLWTDFNCSTYLFLRAYSYTRTSSLTWMFSLCEMFWSCRMFTFDTLYALRSLYSYEHHSARKLFLARSFSLAYFCDWSYLLSMLCSSWWAASVSVRLL